MYTFEGTLKIHESREFTNQEDGTTTKRYTYYFQVEDNKGVLSIVKLNSKTDFTKFVDEDGVGTVTAYPQEKGSGYWLSLTDFKPSTIN